MAHIEKYAQHALGHLFKHYERAKDENGNYIKFSNQNIDHERTHLNYNLAPDRSSQYGFVMDRCKEVYCLKRKNVNLMCSCVLTAPKDLPKEEHEKFFKAGYEHLCQRYGAENVISAYVHMDEGTPHMHFAWVPICYDKGKDRYTVSAKNVVTRQDLKALHPDLEKHISKALGHEVHILTGELSNRPNLTLPQFKTMKAVEEQLAKAEAKLREVSEELKKIEPVLLKVEAIDKIQPKETITGALKNITLEDVNVLKEAAKRVPVLEKDLTELRRENQDLERQIPSLEEHIQAIERDDRLRKLEQAFEKLPPQYKKQIENEISERFEASKSIFDDSKR